jgi:formate hydrogenlyase subunit 3/multisubunit Na+/H+ antiporter MnhD subunit
VAEILLSFLSSLGILMVYPWLAAVIGVPFVIYGWRAGRRGVVTIGVLWVLYSAYETAMHQRWLCTGECNIRVDLLLIYPILLLASVGAVVSLYRSRQTRRR